MDETYTDVLKKSGEDNDTKINQGITIMAEQINKVLQGRAVSSLRMKAKTCRWKKTGTEKSE